MPLLPDIGAKGIGPTKVTPVCQYAINNYLVNNSFINMMPFTNNGMSTATGNFQTSYVEYDETLVAKFRKLGEEYKPDNAQAKVKILMMKQLGGAFNTDIAIIRAFQDNSKALSNYEEQQFRQHMNSVVNAFTKYAFLGDSETDPNQFDGIEKSLIESQIIKEAIDITDIDSTKSYRVVNAVNDAFTMVHPSAGGYVGIVTTEKGIARLNTVNMMLYKYTEMIELGSKKYDTFLGRPMVALPKYCFKEDDLAKGEPVYIIHFAEEGGVHTDVPMDLEIIKYLPPSFDGHVVAQGSLDMVCVPVFPNKLGIAKLYLKDGRDTAEVG